MCSEPIEVNVEYPSDQISVMARTQRHCSPFPLLVGVFFVLFIIFSISTCYSATAREPRSTHFSKTSWRSAKQLEKNLTDLSQQQQGESVSNATIVQDHNTTQTHTQDVTTTTSSPNIDDSGALVVAAKVEPGENVANQVVEDMSENITFSPPKEETILVTTDETSTMTEMPNLETHSPPPPPTLLHEVKDANETTLRGEESSSSDTGKDSTLLHEVPQTNKTKKSQPEVIASTTASDNFSSTVAPDPVIIPETTAAATEISVNKGSLTTEPINIESTSTSRISLDSNSANVSLITGNSSDNTSLPSSTTSSPLTEVINTVISNEMGSELKTEVSSPTSHASVSSQTEGETAISSSSVSTTIDLANNSSVTSEASSSIVIEDKGESDKVSTSPKPSETVHTNATRAGQLMESSSSQSIIDSTTPSIPETMPMSSSENAVTDIPSSASTVTMINTSPTDIPATTTISSTRTESTAFVSSIIPTNAQNESDGTTISPISGNQNGITGAEITTGETVQEKKGSNNETISISPTISPSISQPSSNHTVSSNDVNQLLEPQDLNLNTTGSEHGETGNLTDLKSLELNTTTLGDNIEQLKTYGLVNSTGLLDSSNSKHKHQSKKPSSSLPIHDIYENSLILEGTSPGCMYEDRERFKRNLEAAAFTNMKGMPAMLSFSRGSACVGILKKNGSRRVVNIRKLFPEFPSNLVVDGAGFFNNSIVLIDSSPERTAWMFSYDDDEHRFRKIAVMDQDGLLEQCRILIPGEKRVKIKTLMQISMNNTTCLAFGRSRQPFLSVNASREAKSIAGALKFMLEKEFVKYPEALFSWMDEETLTSIYIYGSDGELYRMFRAGETWNLNNYEVLPYTQFPLPPSLVTRALNDDF